MWGRSRSAPEIGDVPRLPGAAQTPGRFEMADGLGIHGRRRARWLAAAIIGAPILWSGGAQAECGSYEDETRTTYRQVRWEDFRGPGSNSPKRGRGRKAAPDIAYIATSAHVEWSRVATLREGEEWVMGPGPVDKSTI